MPLPKKEDATPENCYIWEQNKNISPITKREIQTNGTIYKLWKKYCDGVKTVETKPTVIPQIPIKKSNLTRNLTKEDCIKWNSNKFKNPISGWTIRETGAIYKEIDKTCNDLLKVEEKKVEEKKVEVKKVEEKKVAVKKVEEKKEEEKEGLYYPDLDDDNFREKISNMYEFNMYKIQPFENIKSIDDFNKISNKFCGSFEKAYYQYLMGQYISSRTPYKSLLIYHSVGVGKTCSAITIAESFLVSHSIYDEPKIWVIMPLALKNSFKGQIFIVLKISFQ